MLFLAMGCRLEGRDLGIRRFGDLGGGNPEIPKSRNPQILAEITGSDTYADKTADRPMDPHCGDWPSALIQLREVDPSSEPDGHATNPSDEPDVEGPDPIRDAPVRAASHLQELIRADEDETVGMLQPIDFSAEESEETTAPQKVPNPDQRSVADISVDIHPKIAGVPVPNDQRPPNLALDGDFLLPPEMAIDVTCAGRGWPYCMYRWEASGLCRESLYFEEVNLERYGYSRFPIAQPAVSAGRFFATAATLPYQMAAQPSREINYTLGYYRPGSCAPYQIHRPPLKPTAATVEAGVIAGLIFAIP